MDQHERSRRGIASALREFLRQESAGGIILMGAAAAALIVANSPFAAIYFSALETYLGPMSVGHWINDALMAVFFLLVGLEIKRELSEGELATWSRRALPGIAAAGGMLVPALVYILVNAQTPENLRGWAIPAATDIAFALGILSLLGKRAPVSLKIFLTALAILDDLGAVLIIAVFYTADLSPLYLGAAAVTLAILVLLNRLKETSLWPYLLLGVLLWYFVWRSGVHATVAGVALAFTIPMHASAKASKPHRAPLRDLEHAIGPMVAFLIVPVFGFANAGVSLIGLTPEAVIAPVPLGVAAGLFFGKQIGVFLAAFAAIKFKLAEMPQGATWRQLYGVAVLCGIGFTMSLFIGLLAFDEALVRDEVKLGVLAGSALSALLGWALLRTAPATKI